MDCFIQSARPVCIRRRRPWWLLLGESWDLGALTAACRQQQERHLLELLIPGRLLLQSEQTKGLADGRLHTHADKVALIHGLTVFENARGNTLVDLCKSCITFMAMVKVPKADRSQVASVALNFRVTPEEAGMLRALVELQQARLDQQGVLAEVTASAVMRRLIRRAYEADVPQQLPVVEASAKQSERAPRRRVTPSTRFKRIDKPAIARIGESKPGRRK